MKRSQKRNNQEGQVEVHVDGQQSAEGTEPEYRFLLTPAEQGGVIIGHEQRDAPRPMTQEDIAAAHEQQYFTSQEFRTAEANQKELAAQEKRQEAELKGTREALRKNEERQLALGRELATYAEEVKTGVRKISIQVVKTITPGNEFVLTDARDGSVIERRTATPEELEESRNNQAGLFGTSDSPNAKPRPDEAPVTISLSIEGLRKAPKKIRTALNDVPYPNADDDDDAYAIAWQASAGRSIAIVPTWVAARLNLLCAGCKDLEFRVEKPDQQRPAAEAA